MALLAGVLAAPWQVIIACSGGRLLARAAAAEYQRRPGVTHARRRQHAHDGDTHHDHQPAQTILTERLAVILIQRVGQPSSRQPTPSKGESVSGQAPMWPLTVGLAARAGRGHQARANRQATGDAGHRDGHQRPEDQRSRLARFE